VGGGGNSGEAAAHERFGRIAARPQRHVGVALAQAERFVRDGGTTILGIVLFHEPASALRLGCIALVVIGIVGLKVTSP
jgi:hypothetical protein